MEFEIGTKNGYLGKVTSNSQEGEVNLKKAEVFVLSSKPNQTSIECLNGTLWITQNNDIEDYFIKEGQTFTVTKRGRVLIQGFPSGRAIIVGHNK